MATCAIGSLTYGRPTSLGGRITFAATSFRVSIPPSRPLLI
jgi:hypothetical protein